MRRLRALVLVMLMAGTAPAAAGSYVVRWGDTLTSLSRRFGVPVRGLADANGITDPNRIVAGRTLTVPGSPASGGGPASAGGGGGGTHVHVVAPGETLASIAADTGTTPRALAEANHLRDPDLVRIGQRLVVPGEARSYCPVSGHHTIVHNWLAPRPGGRRHLGNDVFADRGTNVIANVGGALRHVSGATAGRAYYLAGDDGTTYYGAHLDHYVASAGRVEAGQVIGGVGSTGNAAGLSPHLHFEVHPGGGKAVDSWAYLQRVC
jgi:murein DD-endopeptidase MepM/ murein hydrolase activator NlpD